jgi:hypothetical protein
MLFTPGPVLFMRLFLLVGLIALCFIPCCHTASRGRHPACRTALPRHVVKQKAYIIRHKINALQASLLALDEAIESGHATMLHVRAMKELYCEAKNVDKRDSFAQKEHRLALYIMDLERRKTRKELQFYILRVRALWLK